MYGQVVVVVVVVVAAAVFTLQGRCVSSITCCVCVSENEV